MKSNSIIYCWAINILKLYIATTQRYITRYSDNVYNSILTNMLKFLIEVDLAFSRVEVNTQLHNTVLHALSICKLGHKFNNVDSGLLLCFSLNSLLFMVIISHKVVQSKSYLHTYTSKYTKSNIKSVARVTGHFKKPSTNTNVTGHCTDFSMLNAQRRFSMECIQPDLK